MVRTILLGGAMLLAIPALAQTTGDPTGAAQSGTPTTTNDHDPTMDEAATDVNAGVSTQVNSGTTTPTTGVTTHGNATTHQGMDHSNMPAHGTATTHGTTTAHGTATGTMETTGSTGWSSTTTATTGATTGAAVGGPYVPRDYPMCSRTVTDSCIQAPGRRTRR